MTEPISDADLARLRGQVEQRSPVRDQSDGEWDDPWMYLPALLARLDRAEKALGEILGEYGAPGGSA